MKTHDSYLCPPHCEGCECDDPDHMACNPYWMPGFCPTDGEGDECLASQSEKDYLAEGPPWMHDGAAGCAGRDTIIVMGAEIEL